MMSKILYLTDPTFDFSKVCETSVLLDQVKQNLPDGVYHTSLGDLRVDQIIKMSPEFGEFRLELQGFDRDSLIFYETQSVFQYLNKTELQINLPIQRFTDHTEIDTRLECPMLWVFGCSHSHGVGLKVSEKNYGQCLSEELDLPLRLITKPGSSLAWSYRHLLNSCIKQQDTVVWQLTSPERLSSFNGKHVEEIVLSSSKDRKLIDSISDSQIYFNHLSMLNTGVRYLQSINCRFVIITIMSLGKNYNYLSEYIKYSEFCSTYGSFLDHGSDGKHAGPLSHKSLAQRIYNHLQLRND